MIIVYDRQEGRLQLLKFINSIREQSLIGLYEQVAITRIGGIGVEISEIEDQFEQANFLKMSFCALVELAAKSCQVVDELECTIGNTRFGLSDATFMFLDAPRRTVERLVALEFRHVVEISDFGGGIIRIKLGRSIIGKAD